ncbi:MAG: rod-binding protein [Planctomycetota bacterium]|nr:rod-binding protein [Planctomycetota bacterium]MDA1214082.1 rod-binding protein [Planctomycetota bacterium]
MAGLSAVSSVNSLSAVSSLGRSADVASKIAVMTNEIPQPFAAALNEAGQSNDPTTNLAPSEVSWSTEHADKDDPVRKAFQDFVAGTFYKQMFKALRSGQNKPAYIHGGAAEEMFQSQLDQQVAEDLAANHGSSFSDSLYESFQRERRQGRFSTTA